MSHHAPVLLVLFAAAAVLGLVELLRGRSKAEVESYIADREARAVHVVMNGGMAVMVAPFYDAAVERALLIGYWVAIAVVAARMLLLIARRRPAIANRVAGSVYHLLGLAAMIYALRLMPAGMAGMAMPSPGWLAYALAALFLIDGVTTALLVALFPAALLRMERAIDGPASVLRANDQRTRRALRIAAIPHCVMDFGMVLMLVG